ncbi:MAG TPA: response regulator transcription factor [Planctomycetes bacterium]|nr:response regulator transcription factor [Planctomycetota bacterium]
MTRRLLVVEDDPAMAVGLADTFGLEGFLVTSAGDGRKALDLLFSRHFDVLILDLMLPGLNGLEVLREIREKGLALPVLILTAKGEEKDRILGLELGADDYVTKPFSLGELVARIRALLRREERSLGKARASSERTFRVGPSLVDLSAFEIRRGEKTFPLSPKEAAMLSLLYSRAGKVVTRGMFLNQVWPGEEWVGHRTVDTHILNLRKKLEPRPGKPRFLLTVHGAGYKLVLPEEPP